MSRYVLSHLETLPSLEDVTFDDLRKLYNDQVERDAWVLFKSEIEHPKHLDEFTKLIISDDYHEPSYIDKFGFAIDSNVAKSLLKYDGDVTYYMLLNFWKDDQRDQYCDLDYMTLNIRQHIIQLNDWMSPQGEIYKMLQTVLCKQTP